MINLFEKYDTSSYFNHKINSLTNEIQALTNEQICNSELDELTDFYYEKYKINLIELFLDNKSKDIKEIKIEQYNPFYNSSIIYDKKFYYVDGYNIIYTIPFDGDEKLLYLIPSARIISSFPIYNVSKPSDNSYGNIYFSLELQRDTANKESNLSAFVDNMFSSNFKNYITMINYVNNDCSSYNNSLMNTIKKLLEDRLKKASDFLMVREKLNIPLTQNPNAPNTKPILLRKVKKNKTPSFPKEKIREPEYSISDSDYTNIKNIINLSCISMEKTARTFAKLLEEELRDVILSNLNTHYQGTATGETFNKVGKTDINIPFDNKSAYIAECKIWHGSKKFLEAITQLFSYTTWRDTKTSLIIFNKDNSNFLNILDTINTTLKNNTLCINETRLYNNQWQCTFKKSEDSNDFININICIYDLYIK